MLRHRPLLASTLALGLSLIPAVARPSGVEPPAEPTVREIVAASLRASGGEALDEVRTVRRRADMHLDGEMFGALDGTWEIAFHPGKKSYQKATFGDAATITVWDGNGGWEESVMGLRELDPEEIALARWQSELSPLHALARAGRIDSMKRGEDETIDGRLHYVLGYTDEIGTETRIYIDSETSLVSRLETSVYLAILGTCAVTNDYSDYREIEGVLLPETSSQVIEKLWSYRARFTETELDPELPESLFERPGESP